MEWSKLKTIMILILAAADLFLLILVAGHQSQAARYEEDARSDAVDILEKNGVTMDPALLPEAMDLSPMTAARQTGQERDQAAGLLGSLTAGSPDSSIYEGERGKVRFYADGKFTATFQDGAYPVGNQTPAQCALSALSLIGFKGEVLGEDGTDTSLLLRQTLDGTPLFSCTVTAGFQNGCLQTLDGKRLTGTPARSTSSGQPLRVVTILMRFLDLLSSTGDICNQITGMTAGYVVTVTSPVGTATLSPAWYIVTDTGSYLLNAYTGAPA